MATIEKRYLAPLNPSTTIKEADRSRVYNMIGKELAGLLTGNQSYYPDGIQKDASARASDLRDFIASITELKSRVNDPSDILGKAVDDLGDYANAFQKIIEGNEPVDHIEMPQEWSPITKDHNEMYIPDLGPFFSPPNPLSPYQWKKELEASLGSPDDTNPLGETRPDIYPRLRRRTVSSALADAHSLNRTDLAPAQQPDRPLGIFSGKPMPDHSLPPSIWGLPDNSAASGNGVGNWFTSLAGAASFPTGASRNIRSSPVLEPQKSQGSPPSILPDYTQYLNRLDGKSPQASMFGPGAPAVPFAPLENPNSMGGLADRLAALAGIDPENPDQTASQPGGLLGLFLSGRR